MFPYNQILVDIPEIFHSVEFDGPFQKCQICTREIYHDSQAYMIEKVFRGSETIIELATCLPCAVEMQSEISAESTLVIQQEFQSKVNLQERLSWLGQDPAPVLDSQKEVGVQNKSDDEIETESNIVRPELDASKWLEQCILSNTPRDSMNSYQVVGMFFGNQMALSVFPYLISSKSIEEIGEKLSEQTRGFMQDFIDTQFGMPPEFCSPDSPLPLLI